jgi:D-glycero-D-manno-heptose 1,7-bisphosphate phosphatase
MKLIILDRDGVINHDSKHFITAPEQWKPLPGSVEAMARLTQAGYKIAIATNQSGLGRGLFGMATLNAIHAKMNKTVQEAGGRIDAIFYCPHPEEAKCACRKPNTGMFDAIAERFGVSLQDVDSVGDSIRDLQAAHVAGARPVLVLTGKGERTQREDHLPPGTTVYATLSAFVDATVQ